MKEKRYEISNHSRALLLQLIKDVHQSKGPIDRKSLSYMLSSISCGVGELSEIYDSKDE